MVALRMAARLRFAQGSERLTALFADLRLVGFGGFRSPVALCRNGECGLTGGMALKALTGPRYRKTPKALALGAVR
jgi:hypothetical protein